MYEHELSGRSVEDRRVRERRPAPPRRTRGPRPSRPGVVAVAVRPAQAERPKVARVQRRAEPLRQGPRLLVRRARPVASALVERSRVRRAMAGLGVTVVVIAVVVGLGLLADVAAQSRGASLPPAPVATVTVAAEATVWDVARRVAPEVSEPELAALTERIVTENSLTSVQLHPGQVLRVTVG